MRKTSRAEKICTVCEKIGDIGDSVKGSSSRMKNKVGAQKGAFIKMKQENIYIYQWLYRLRYVPIIAPFQTLPRSTEINANPVYCGFQCASYFFRVTCTTFSASPFLVGSSEVVNQASSKWLIISSGPVPGPIRLLSRFNRM